MRRFTIVLALLATIGVGAPSAQAKVVKRTATTFTVPLWMSNMTPCVFEDGSGGRLPCYWNGTKRGNGTGLSYWVDRNGEFHYVKTITVRTPHKR